MLGATDLECCIVADAKFIAHLLSVKVCFYIRYLWGDNWQVNSVPIDFSIHRFLLGLHQGWWQNGNILILPFYLLAGILLYRKAFIFFPFLFNSMDTWIFTYLLC